MSLRCRPIRDSRGRAWLLAVARSFYVVKPDEGDKLGVRVVYGDNWKVWDQVRLAAMLLVRWGSPRTDDLIGMGHVWPLDYGKPHGYGWRPQPLSMLIFAEVSWLTFAIWEVDEGAAMIARDAVIANRADEIVGVFAADNPPEIATVRAAVALEQANELAANERQERARLEAQERIAAESLARATGDFSALRPASALPPGRVSRAAWHRENSGRVPPRSAKRATRSR